LLEQVSMATWRNGRPPVLFSDPVHIVLPRHGVVLHPFEGQPRKYTAPLRLPGLEVKKSGIAKAGFGLFLRENVRAGQAITKYCRKIISEATANRMKKKVSMG
jgi:hypothetical protein